MITIQNLHKAFGKNEVLTGVELNFDKPGITAVLGPNGSGKTTLIKCVLGMVIPDKGCITMDGESIEGHWAYRENLSYLPQIARFPENLTGRELLDMVKDMRSGTANDNDLIELFDLGPHLDKRLGNLSGGTRQKINLVLAFMYDNPVIILDEPTAGLDPVSLLHLKEVIAQEKKRGKTILITTHIMSLVEQIADEIVFLLEGKIHFKGSTHTLKERYNETSVEKAIASMMLQQNGKATAVKDIEPSASPAMEFKANQN